MTLEDKNEHNSQVNGIFKAILEVFSREEIDNVIFNISGREPRNKPQSYEIAYSFLYRGPLKKRHNNAPNDISDSLCFTNNLMDLIKIRDRVKSKSINKYNIICVDVTNVGGPGGLDWDGRVWNTEVIFHVIKNTTATTESDLIELNEQEILGVL